MGSGFFSPCPCEHPQKNSIFIFRIHCKNSLLVKASQSSLYREIENLMLWFIPVGNNIPKDFALRQLGERMLNEMTDALTACNLALQTSELRQRLELINLIKLHMTTVQSITKVFVEFSSREGNVRRVISQSQRASLLKMMSSIGGQMARWAKSTESALKQGLPID